MSLPVNPLGAAAVAAGVAPQAVPLAAPALQSILGAGSVAAPGEQPANPFVNFDYGVMKRFLTEFCGWNEDRITVQGANSQASMAQLLVRSFPATKWAEICSICLALPNNANGLVEAKESKEVKEAKEAKFDDFGLLAAPSFGPFGAAQPAFAAAAPSARGGLGLPLFAPAVPPARQPAHALGFARQMAAPAFSYQLLPEAFLPASLPAALADKMEKGEFINFDDSLRLFNPTSVAVDKPDPKSADAAEGKCKSLREWLLVYSALLAWCADFKPDELRDRVSYLKSFVQHVSRCGFAASYEYDKNNRHYCARSGAPFSIFKADLWLPPATVAPASAIPRKRLREHSDRTSAGKRREKESRYHEGKEICFLFNINRCKATPCPAGRAHVCWLCSKEHAKSACSAGSAPAAPAHSKGKS